MEIIRDIANIRSVVQNARRAGKRVGFVPTMGALHSAHMSLVKIARERSDYSVVSIFVNPIQFAPDEDFERYPRTPDQDCELLEAEGVDVVFLPSPDAMYPVDASVSVDPGPVSRRFEGRARPTHFRGVLTVVAKLFGQIQPDLAVFGEKDAQQFFLIKRMVRDLDMPIEIIAGPTIRESDGLALSSRNRYLKKAERDQADVLFRALDAGVESFTNGERSLDKIREVMREVIDEVPEFSVDYYTAVDDDSFEERNPLTDRPRFLIAGSLGSVRLIDNQTPPTN